MFSETDGYNKTIFDMDFYFWLLKLGKWAVLVNPYVTQMAPNFPAELYHFPSVSTWLRFICYTTLLFTLLPYNLIWDWEIKTEKCSIEGLIDSRYDWTQTLFSNFCVAFTCSSLRNCMLRPLSVVTKYYKIKSFRI